MSIELIYRTSDPRAVAWFKETDAERTAVRELRRAYEAKMTEEFGPMGKRDDPYGEEHDVRPLIVGQTHVSGIGCGRNEQPPEGSGWRLDARERWWYPKLATAKGKERKAELAKLAFKRLDPDPIGVDEMHWGDGYLYRPIFVLREDLGEVWVAWSAFECRGSMKDRGEEGIVWGEVPRSEWYAWREKVEAETLTNFRVLK